MSIGGINTLIQGLNKAGVQTAIKEFSGAMKSMETTTKLGGMENFKGLFDSVQAVIGSPLLVPMQVILAKLAAGTADASMKTMERVLTTLEGEGVNTGLKVFGDVLTAIASIPSGLEVVGTLINFFTDPEGTVKDFADQLEKMGVSMGVVDTVFNTAGKEMGMTSTVMNDILRLFGLFNTAVGDLGDTMDDTIDKLNGLTTALTRVDKALKFAGTDITTPGFQEFG